MLFNAAGERVCKSPVYRGLYRAKSLSLLGGVMYLAVQEHQSAWGFAPSLPSQTPRTSATGGQAERAAAGAAGAVWHSQLAGRRVCTHSGAGKALLTKPCCLPPLQVSLPSTPYLPAPARLCSTEQPVRLCKRQAPKARVTRLTSPPQPGGSLRAGAAGRSSGRIAHP